MLNSGLGPASAGLIFFLQQRCRSFVYLDVSIPAIRQVSPANSPVNNTYQVLANPLKIPAGDGQLDLVVSYWSAHHCSDFKKLLAEIFRILKPGGHFLLADGMDAKGSPAQELHHQIHNLSIAIDRASHRQHYSLFSLAELTELLHGVGFRKVEKQEITDTAEALATQELNALRNEMSRVLNKVYPAEICQIPGGQRRFGKKLSRLSQAITSSPLQLHPYAVLCASKPHEMQAFSSPNSAKEPQEAVHTGGHYHQGNRNKGGGYQLRFRDLPDEFKPREKLIMNGPEALKNHELLAALLGSGSTRENVIELSKRLIKEYGSRALAQERSVRRLRETLGVGSKKACQIVAAFELGRRFFEEPRKKAPVILAAEDAYEYLKEMAKFTREHFRGLYLNTRGRVIRDEIISIGSLNMSVVHPREVFLPAVEFSAAAVILAHNHPSGDPTPSEEDLAITQQMLEAGRVMNIEVFDHIIIGDDSYVSLQKEGKLK